MSLLSFPGEVVVFLTYGMHFSGTQAELGDIRKMGTTFRAPSLLAGSPPTPRSPSLDPMALVPEARRPADARLAVPGLLPGAVVGPVPQTHPASPALPEMQRLAPID